MVKTTRIIDCYQSSIGKVCSKFLLDGFPQLIYGARRKALATIDLGVSYPFGRAPNSFVGLGSPPPPPARPWSFVVPKCPSSLEYYNNSQKAFVTNISRRNHADYLRYFSSPPPTNPAPHNPLTPSPTRVIFICIPDYASDYALRKYTKMKH